MSKLTPETLRQDAEFAAFPTDGYWHKRLRAHADAWEQQVARMQFDFEKAADRALDTTPAGRAYLAKHQAELEAVKAREEGMLGLLRQGRAILSNDTNIKIQGDLIGQVVFGDWSAKVDAALAASEPPGTARPSLGEEGT